MPATLRDGRYTITCRANGFSVGRHRVEDRTQRPKRVMMLSPAGSLRGASSAPWLIQAAGGENLYELRAGGAPVGAVNTRLVAHLAAGERERADVWAITPCPALGDGCFTIQKPDLSAAWTASHLENETPLAVMPLEPAERDIPAPPESHVFVIEAAAGDSE